MYREIEVHVHMYVILRKLICIVYYRYMLGNFKLFECICINLTQEFIINIDSIFILRAQNIL